MNQVQINVHVDQAIAMRAGRTVFGMTTIIPTSVQLQELTEDEREALCEFTGASKAIFVKTPDPSWEGVVNALRAELAKRAAKAELERVETEGRISVWLSVPDDKLLAREDRVWWRWRVSAESGPPLRYAEMQDPRVQARVKALEPIAAARTDRDLHERLAALEAEMSNGSKTVAEREALGLERFPELGYTEHEALERFPEGKLVVERYDAMREAYVKQIADEKKAQIELVKSALCEYAKQTDKLARAASEGYEVSRAVLDHIVQRILSNVPAGGVTSCLIEDEGDWDRYSWEERSAPNAEAFALRDKIEHAVRMLRDEKPIVPACVELEVTRIMRVMIEPNRGESEWDQYTGIVVWIRTPTPGLSDRAIVFNAEH